MHFGKTACSLFRYYFRCLLTVTSTITSTAGLCGVAHMTYRVGCVCGGHLDTPSSIGENRLYCAERRIQLNGPKLGRYGICPAKATGTAMGEGNVVDGKFGEGKRSYGLNRVTMSMKKITKVAIQIIF